jgi:RluA family pseudouridine synthase
LIVVEKHYTKECYTVRLLIEETDHDSRLDQIIQDHLTSFSREEVKRRISAKEIFIEGRDHRMKSSTRVKMGEVLYLTIPRTTQEDEYWNGEKINIEETPTIVFEDADLIVISKPAYMAAHPTGKHIFNCATVFFETLYKKTVHALHRLDRETSGLLLLSKNPKLAKLVTTQFENDLVRKVYLFIAVANKDEIPDTFIANERLGPKNLGLERIHIHAFDPSSDEGKEACTHFRILHREGSYVLGLAFPQTGRQHQIRVHAATHGLPLLGDKIYLGSFKMFQRFKDGLASPEDHQLMQLPRHALHALALSISYQNKHTTFQSGLPTDLKEWITANLALDLVKFEDVLKAEVQSYFNSWIKADSTP